MKTISHPSSYFEAPTSGVVDIIFGMSEACCFTAELISKKNNETVKLENMVFIIQTKTMATFRVRFPEHGKIVVKFYGKERGSDGMYTFIFRYLINVIEPMMKCSPFSNFFTV